MVNNQSADEVLWEETVRGDTYAFDLLFSRYWKKIYTTAYKHLKSVEICEEITQDIFIALWNNKERIHIHSLPAYLNTSAKYSVYKHLKVACSSPLQYMEDLAGIDKGYTDNEGVKKIDLEETLAVIQSHLVELPKRCREIFVMSRIDNMSIDDIAKKLQISRRTVENQITLAVKHLRKKLEFPIVFVLLFIFFK